MSRPSRCARAPFVLLVAVAAAAGGSLPATDAVAVPWTGPVGSTVPVCVSATGVHTTADCLGGAISGDGRYVAFMTASPVLAPGDTSGTLDVLRLDRRTGRTILVNRTPRGTPSRGHAYWPSISADGRYVAFESEAADLVPGDTNGTWDVFLRDVVAGTTTRVSVSAAGAQGDAGSGDATVSADGRRVAFRSLASTLVPGDTNGSHDLFVRDLAAGTTVRADVADDGAQLADGAYHPVLSPDGSVLAFTSARTDLDPAGPSTNGVYVRDLAAARTRRVEATGGASGSAVGPPVALSTDGRLVLVGGAVVDRRTGVADEVCRRVDPTQQCSATAMSADGRFVVLDAIYTALRPAGSQPAARYFHAFVRDRRTGALDLLSATSTGQLANYGGTSRSISADGRTALVQSSFSTNLSPEGLWKKVWAPGDDEPIEGELYVRDRLAPPTSTGDVDRDGQADVLVVQRSTGKLLLVRGDGLHAAVRRTLATGWGRYDATTRVGDLDRDGYDDVVARSRTSGRLLLFRGTGTALRAPVQIGGPRWAGMREITGVGDLDGDGYRDLVAIEKATGRLYLVPGRGTSLGARRLVGLTWASMGELAGVGDLDRDGHPDLVARKNATGELFLYRGRGSGTTAGFRPRVRIGASGWDTMRDLVGAGDVDRDGRNDLLAVDVATGRLLRYPGTGTGLRSRQVFGTGFTADLHPLA